MNRLLFILPPSSLLLNLAREKHSPEDGNFVERDDHSQTAPLASRNHFRPRGRRWIGGWLSRLSARQIGDAFRAANYAPDEVQLLTDAVRRRVGELTALRGRAASAGAPEVTDAPAGVYARRREFKPLEGERFDEEA